MFERQRAVAWVAFVVLAAVRCGGGTSDDGPATGASGASGSAGTTGASGASGSAGTSGTSGASGASGSASAGVTSCDPRAIQCRRLPPVCPEGEAPSVVGTCYGECVPIDRCGCSEAAACPEPNTFTCHLNRQRCGPYVG